MKNRITTLLLLFASISLQAQEYLMVADVMPKFGTGGYTGITKYIDANVDYPPQAYFSKKEGEANIRFVVKDDSKIVLMSPAYMKTLGYGLEDAMMKVLNGMPAWTPGIQDKKKVNVWVFLPYTFKLPKEMPYFKEQHLKTKAQYSGSENKMLQLFQDSCSIKDFDGLDTKTPVLLDLYIDSTGKVTKAEINKMDSSNTIFHKTAKETALKLKEFSPAFYDGKKARSIKTISVAYNVVLEKEIEIVKDIPKPVEGKKIYQIVEQPAVFPGGFSAMMAFIQKNIKYPDEAKYNDKSGAVYIQITITEKGEVTDIKPAMVKEKLLGFGLEEEAMRVIKLMPNWVPAEQGGEIVAQKFTIPIMFELTGGRKKKSKKSKR